MSSNQYRTLLEKSGISLEKSSEFKVCEIGQGSGTLLKTLGKALGSKNIYAFDNDTWANYRAKKRNVEKN